jgi:hypothetical protein
LNNPAILIKTIWKPAFPPTHYPKINTTIYVSTMKLKAKFNGYTCAIVLTLIMMFLNLTGLTLFDRPLGKFGLETTPSTSKLKWQ